MKEVTDPSILDALNKKEVTDPEILKQLEPGLVDAFSSPDFLGAVKQNAATIGSTLVNPETYKKLGYELTHFPPIDKQKMTSREEVENMANVALSVLPITPLAKASRLAIGGKVDDVSKLIAEGVNPTIGQKIGGAVKRTEEALTSVPILGDVIKGAQRKGIEEFNRAAVNRALQPAIGEKLPKGVQIGHRAVDFAYTKISKAYDELIPKLSGKLDDTLLNSLGGVDDIAKQLPDEGKQLYRIIDQNILKKFSKDGTISGEALQDSLSRVKNLVRLYGKSQDPDQRLLGDALHIVKDSVDDMLKRFNPAQSEKFDRLNLGFANLIRVEQAAASSKNGVFTPSQLVNAVKATDSSLRKTSVARGKALMQDLATSGQNVLAQSLPDSGTALRLSPYILAGGAGYAGDKGYISPMAAAAIIGLSTAYTPIGRGFGTTLRNQAIQRGLLGYTANK